MRAMKCVKSLTQFRVQTFAIRTRTEIRIFMLTNSVPQLFTHVHCSKQSTELYVAPSFELYNMASFHDKTNDNTWLKHFEDSCLSMNSVENQPLPAKKEDPLAQHWLHSIDEDDPFGEGIRCDIQLHIDKLVESGFQEHLKWIQSCLLVACSARLGTYEGTTFGEKSIYCVTQRNRVACPIVARNAEESSALRSELFRFVMAQLNLYPSVPHTLLLPRIPPDWSADTLYTVARLLGPVHQCQVDVNLSFVHQVPLTFIDCPSPRIQQKANFLS